MSEHDLTVRNDRTGDLAVVSITDLRGESTADSVFDAIEAAEGLSIQR